MQAHITDLDALLLTVRQPLSRSYIQEAIQAFRAGSYKASIVSIWVAVTFDIISKIRELSENGDGAATTFIATFDANVQNNNKKKLLEIEGSLLEAAEKQFEFLDAISKRQFDRLKEDRNLCAHPAFTANGQLFSPEPELVRLYIVEAVRNLLSQRPVQGKTIINQFDGEFRSASFPTSPETITRYVASRYLANSRAGVHASLGAVFAKALLKQTPAGWEGKLGRLAPALQAIRNGDADAWQASISPTISRLIEEADDDYIPNAYHLLRRFDDIRAGLSEAANTRLLSYIENLAATEADVRAFEAAAIQAFADAAAINLAASDTATQIAVIRRFPMRPYWPIAIAAVRAARSFRGAEGIFADYVLPFSEALDPGQVTELLRAISSNAQVYNAGGIPPLLLAVIQEARDRFPLTHVNIDDFTKVVARRNLWQFEETLDVFQHAGMQVPQPPDEEDEI